MHEQLGPYEIIERLGAGGMGEVYRAHDPRLKRDVAIKVLPQAVAADAERVARLRREAQLLAHTADPHLAAVHGLEDADGTTFLVMELIEGRGLDDLVDEALPVAEVLDIAAQIASGLAAAHERGIVHRDLKPANVRVTADGVAKVLDFGLARADPEGAAAGSTPDLTASPTVAAATLAGVILGTAAYMSPEQARGKPVDRRTDVWSFGCVLFEMLTGARPFAGETVTDVMAAIVKDEPDWTSLPGDLDARVVELLRRCLRKDLRQRHRDLGDASLQLREVIRRGADASPAVSLPATAAAAADVPEADRRGDDRRARFGGREALAGWAVAGLMTILAIWGWIVRPTGETGAPTGRRLTWLTIPPPSGAIDLHRPGERTVLGLTPRGGALLHTIRVAGERRLALRSLDDPEHRIIEGTEGATQLAFSPTGDAVAIASASNIRVIPPAGGPAREVCRPCSAGFGLTWSDSGSLISAGDWGRGLEVTPVSGGSPTPLTSIDATDGAVSHLYPAALPGGTHVLFSIWSPAIDERRAAVVALDSGTVRVVASGGNYYRYVAGHLLFERAGVLSAQPFDLGTLATTGPAFALIENLARISADGFAAYTVSASGVLAFMRGVDGEPTEAIWVDRSGVVAPAVAEPGPFNNPALSRDGRLLAVAAPVENAGYRVRVYDLAGGTRVEVSPEGDNVIPLFSPDGRRVFFATSDFGGYAIASAPVDGSDPPEMFVRLTEYGGPTDWSPDGSTLLFDQGTDIWMVSEGSETRPLVSTPAHESGATFSPDGEWIVYTSDADGTDQLYLAAADGVAAPRQITQGGADAARWSPAGGEIFFQREEGIWSLPIETRPSIRVGAAERILTFETARYADAKRPEFDVAADGRRFLLLGFVAPAPEFLQIQVIDNLTELIRRRAPSR